MRNKTHKTKPVSITITHKLTITIFFCLLNIKWWWSKSVNQNQIKNGFIFLFGFDWKYGHKQSLQCNQKCRSSFFCWKVEGKENIEKNYQSSRMCSSGKNKTWNECEQQPTKSDFCVNEDKRCLNLSDLLKL